ncbi:MAG: hypothetical protein RI564_03425 [Gracilimonas sp.]|jgi:hypothetical protein|nr:hypothetical protein [Gracilimonas sp.]
MTAQIVIILVGIALSLLATIDYLIGNDSEKRLINSKVRAFLAITGICLLIYGGFAYSAVNLQGQIEQPETENIRQVDYPVERVQIISPIENDSVACRILTKGVYPESHEKEIWVLLKPSDDKYYPQSDHTNTSFKRNGEWQVITRFGGDKGEEFDIIVYETNPEASQFFSTTIQEWKDNLSYPGLEMEELPEGAEEIERIEVMLEENCRGVF